MTQLKKPIILYFIGITILQFIPNGPKNPLNSALTLIFMIWLLMMKDMYDAKKKKELE